MALTAEQIARQAGCSVATVSRVLNNSGRVSEASRQAVLEAVRESGAMPRLRGKRSRRKAAVRTPAKETVEILLVRNMPMEQLDVRSGRYDVGAVGSLTVDRFFAPGNRYANSYFRKLVEGALDEMKRFGQRTILRATPSLKSPELLAQINAPAVQGLIIMGDFDPDTLRFINQVHCPIVTLTTWAHDGWPDYVGIQNTRGIGMAFDHLHSLGHTRIGYVAGSTTSAVFRERLQAYQNKMHAAGLAVRPEWIVEGSSHINEIAERVLPVLKSKNRPTAIIGCYAGAALAVNQVADRLEITIPKDLSIVGFDDDEISNLCHPALTTVRVPVIQMGRRAVQLLMMRRLGYGNDRSDGIAVRVVPELIVRQSTSGPPAI